MGLYRGPNFWILLYRGSKSLEAKPLPHKFAAARGKEAENVGASFHVASMLFLGEGQHCHRRIACAFFIWGVQGYCYGHLGGHDCKF